MPTLAQLRKSALPASLVPPVDQPEEPKKEPWRYTPQVDNSFVATTGRALGGGIGAVGNLLDLPGSMVRDTIALKNPLDQLIDPLGYNADKNRTTGRDLLRQYGAVGQDDSYSNWWAGFAAEVLTDPLTYTGIGALTKAGKVGQKAGLNKLARETANTMASKVARESADVATKGAKSARLTRPMRGFGSRVRVTPQDIINSGSDDVERAARKKMWEDAGGTDDLLNQPLQSVLSFRVPGVMKEPLELRVRDRDTIDVMGDWAARNSEYVGKNAPPQPPPSAPPSAPTPQQPPPTAPPSATPPQPVPPAPTPQSPQPAPIQQPPASVTATPATKKKAKPKAKVDAAVVPAEPQVSALVPPAPPAPAVLPPAPATIPQVVDAVPPQAIGEVAQEIPPAITPEVASAFGVKGADAQKVASVAEKLRSQVEQGRQAVDETPVVQPVPDAPIAKSPAVYEFSRSDTGQPFASLNRAMSRPGDLTADDVDVAFDIIPESERLRFADAIKTVRPDLNPIVKTAMDRVSPKVEIPDIASPAQSFGDTFKKVVDEGGDPVDARYQALASHLSRRGLDIDAKNLRDNWWNHHISNLPENATDEQIIKTLESSRSVKQGDNGDAWWLEQPVSKTNVDKLKSKRSAALERAAFLDDSAKVLDAAGSSKGGEFRAEAERLRGLVASSEKAQSEFEKSVAAQTASEKATREARMAWRQESEAKPMTLVAMAKDTVGLVDGSWTNGRVLLKLPEQEFAKVSGEVAKRSIAHRADDNMAGMAKRALDSVSPVDEVASPVGYRQWFTVDKKKGREIETEHPTVLLQNGKNFAVIDGGYHATIQKIYPGAEYRFKQTKGVRQHTDAIAITHNGNLVGTLMPLKMDEIDDATKAAISASSKIKQPATKEVAQEIPPAITPEVAVYDFSRSDTGQPFDSLNRKLSRPSDLTEDDIDAARAIIPESERLRFVDTIETVRPDLSDYADQKFRTMEDYYFDDAQEYGIDGLWTRRLGQIARMYGMRNDRGATKAINSILQDATNEQLKKIAESRRYDWEGAWAMGDGDLVAWPGTAIRDKAKFILEERSARTRFSPIIKDGAVDYAATSDAFDAISLRHAEYNTKVIAPLVSAKVLKEGDAAFLQTVLADSDMRLIPEGMSAEELTKSNSAALGIDEKQAAYGASDIPTGTVYVKKGSEADFPRASILLHETGHIIFSSLGKSDPKLFRAANSAIQKALENGSESILAKYFGTSGKNADYFSKNTSEAFAQLFSNVAIGKIAPDELPKTLLDAVKKVWQTVIKYAKNIIGANNAMDPRLKPIEDLVNYAGGYISASKRNSILKALGEVQSGVAVAEDGVNLFVSPASIAQRFKQAATSFKDTWTNALGSQSNLASAVADVVDRGGDLFYATGPGRVLAALFRPELFGATTEAGRNIGKMRSEAMDESIVQFRQALDPVLRTLDGHGGFNVDKIMQSGVDQKMATGQVNKNVIDFVRYVEGVGRLPKYLDTQEMRDAADIIIKIQDDARKEVNDSGLNMPELQDLFVRYLTRNQAMPGKSSIRLNPRSGMVVETKIKSMNQRKFRDIPGGRAVLDEMSLDPLISGYKHRKDFVRRKLDRIDYTEPVVDYKGSKVSLREYVFDRYGSLLVPVQKLKGYDPSKSTTLDGFIDTFADLDPAYADEGMPLFGRNFLADVASYTENAYRAAGMAKMSQQLLANTALLSDYADPANKLFSINDVVDKVRFGNRGRTFANIANAMGVEERKAFKQMVVNDADEIAADIASGKDATRTKDGVEYTLKQGSSQNEILVTSKRKTRKLDADGNVVDDMVDHTETIDLTANPRYLVDLAEQDVAEDFLKRFGVEGDIATDIARFMRPYTEEEAFQFFEKGIRKFVNVTKASFTAPFPSFHMRNLISGQMASYMLGAYRNPKEFYNAISDAYKLRLNQAIDLKSIKGYENLSADLSREKMKSEIFAMGLIGERQGLAAELIGDDIGTLASQMPGMKSEVNPLKLKFAKQPQRSAIDAVFPFAVKDGFTIGKDGLKRVDRDLFAGATIGRDVASFVEDLNRITPYLSLRRQGYSPRAARDVVNKMQVDYTKLSAFESRWARLLVPFYTFSRRMLPVWAEELATNPGGVTAVTVKAANRSRDPNEVVPDHIADTVGFPMGETSDGSKRYLTGLGLAFEDSLNLLNGPLRMDPMATIREVGSRSNPLLKGTAELAFGRSLFQDGPDGGGRELNDMDPTIGRTIQNVKDIATGERTKRAEPFINRGFEFIAANSPASRYATTARTLTDPRKWENPISGLGFNLLTGIRVNDVSPQSQDAIYLERLGQELKRMGSRNFVRPYIPDDRKERLSEADRILADKLLGEIKNVTNRFKERREAEKN